MVILCCCRNWCESHYMDENIFQIGAEVSHQAKTKATARTKVKVNGWKCFLEERERTEESLGKCGALSAVQSWCSSLCSPPWHWLLWLCAWHIYALLPSLCNEGLCMKKWACIMSSKVCRYEVWKALDSTSPSQSWPARQTHTNQRRPDSSCYAYPCASQTLAPISSHASRCASTSSNALSPSDDTTSTTAISSSMDVGDGDATNTSVPCGRHGNPNASRARATCNATTSFGCRHSRARHLRSSTPKHDCAKGQLQCRHRGAGHGYDYPNECSDGCNWNVDLPHSDATESCSRANTTTKSLYT